MPIYEYHCAGCGHEQGAIQKFSDAPLTDCEECGAPQLRKKISAAGFRLKGGGWYETDFKSSNKRNVAGDTHAASSGDSGSASAGAGESTSSGSGKGEGKAESKAEKKSSSQESGTRSKAAANS